jgi:hypothetical protein
MANLEGLNDPTGGERQKPFEAGEYTLAMVKSDMVESKKTPGNWYLECEFEIEGSPRRVWERYNLSNSSATAQEIAWRDFNSLKHACGKLQVNDSSELHGIPFRGRVNFEKGDETKLKLGTVKPLNAAPGGNAGNSGNPSQGTSGTGASGPWNQNRQTA